MFEMIKCSRMNQGGGGVELIPNNEYFQPPFRLLLLLQSQL